MGFLLVKQKPIEVYKSKLKLKKQKKKIRKHKSQNQCFLIAVQQAKGFQLQIKPKANKDPDHQKSKPTQNQNQGFQKLKRFRVNTNPNSKTKPQITYSKSQIIHPQDKPKHQTTIHFADTKMATKSEKALKRNPNKPDAPIRMPPVNTASGFSLNHAGCVC